MESRDFTLIDTIEMVESHPALESLRISENPWTTGASDIHLESSRIITVSGDDGDVVVTLRDTTGGQLAQGRASGSSLGASTSMMAVGLILSLTDVDDVLGDPEHTGQARSNSADPDDTSDPVAPRSADPVEEVASACVGLPVVVALMSNGEVTVSVDLSEASDATSEADEDGNGATGDMQVLATALEHVPAWVSTSITPQTPPQQ